MIITTDKVLRPRDEHDHYPTPVELCRAALALIPSHFYLPDHVEVLDPGCGDGVWGRAFKSLYPSAGVAGVELRDIPYPAGYNELYRGDFLDLAIPNKYDAVIGNPPYKFAEEFVRKAHDCLWDRGVVVMLLRLAFLEGQARSRGLWKDYPPRRVAILSRRPSFTGNGKTDATAYAVYVWVKSDSPPIAPFLSWLEWDYEVSS